MLRRVFALLALVASAAAVAHHSFAMFDMQKDLELHAVARTFSWQSPHTWLEVNSTDANRVATLWSIEMGAPNALYRRGLRADSVKPGDKVTVIIHPLRDGRPGGSLVSVTLANGTTLNIGGGAGSPATSAAK